MKIIRPKEEIIQGIKRKKCDFIELYSNLCGRVQQLRVIDENVLEEIYPQGHDKSGLRRVIIVPDFPLNKITSSDILVIPWGVRPNTWTPPFATDGLGPQIWISTPTGNLRLSWDGNSFASDRITLNIEENTWCFSGEIDHCFESCGNFCSDPFPEGYSFLKTTGPNALFEITLIDPHEDHLGRIAYYKLLVEHLDQNKVILTE